MNIKQEYRSFLNNNFKGLDIKPPLFYNWQNGLRFDLQMNSEYDSLYFAEVVRRATLLYESVFDADDAIYLVLTEHKYKRQKIRKYNYVFNQIKNLSKHDINYYVEKNFYNDFQINDPYNNHNVAIVKTIAKNVRHEKIFWQIAYGDFTIVNKFDSKRVYFVNVSKKLIFNMYDDRGLDIVASDKEVLRPIYDKHNTIILDYNREKIDILFKDN